MYVMYVTEFHLTTNIKWNLQTYTRYYQGLKFWTHTRYFRVSGQGWNSKKSSDASVFIYDFTINNCFNWLKTILELFFHA